MNQYIQWHGWISRILHWTEKPRNRRVHSTWFHVQEVFRRQRQWQKSQRAKGQEEIRQWRYSIVLTAVVVRWVDIFVHICWTVCLKCMHITTCKLCFDLYDFKKRKMSAVLLSPSPEAKPFQHEHHAHQLSQHRMQIPVPEVQTLTHREEEGRPSGAQASLRWVAWDITLSLSLSFSPTKHYRPRSFC